MHRHLLRGTLAVLALSLALAAAAPLAAAPPGNAYTVHNLVSDEPGVADHQDPNLVNAWGLAALPGSPWWVADNETSVSTLYNADGTARTLVVHVPNAPTGEVANSSPNFQLAAGGGNPALFLWATEEGKILAWNPSLTPINEAVVVADRSGVGAIYKGLAIAGNRLYAADFHHARVDVFDENFDVVNMPGAFVDPGIPAGFAPFGIQEVGGKILVAYAKQDADAEDEVAGQGLGFVDAFDTSGAFLGRVATRGQLNAPWGLALAPNNFSRFSNDLLVGNFGDGEINAYEPQADGTYERVGALKDTKGNPILIDGLWALQFGHGALVNNGPTNALFFTAGPDDETHGLFGMITAG
jgi:uncharacterized protein (TIGR03118 family)